MENRSEVFSLVVLESQDLDLPRLRIGGLVEFGDELFNHHERLGRAGDDEAIGPHVGGHASRHVETRGDDGASPASAGDRTAREQFLDDGENAGGVGGFQRQNLHLQLANGDAGVDFLDDLLDDGEVGCVGGDQ